MGAQVGAICEIRVLSLSRSPTVVTPCRMSWGQKYVRDVDLESSLLCQSGVSCDSASRRLKATFEVTSEYARALQARYGILCQTTLLPIGKVWSVDGDVTMPCSAAKHS